jgi:hypothetical protein
MSFPAGGCNCGGVSSSCILCTTDTTLFTANDISVLEQPFSAVLTLPANTLKLGMGIQSILATDDYDGASPNGNDGNFTLYLDGSPVIQNPWSLDLGTQEITGGAGGFYIFGNAGGGLLRTMCNVSGFAQTATNFTSLATIGNNRLQNTPLPIGAFSAFGSFEIAIDPTIAHTFHWTVTMLLNPDPGIVFRSRFSKLIIAA